MNFNKHSNLVGQHAFLGASKYHWLNYDVSKIAEAFRPSYRTVRATPGPPPLLHRRQRVRPLRHEDRELRGVQHANTELFGLRELRPRTLPRRHEVRLLRNRSGGLATGRDDGLLRAVTGVALECSGRDDGEPSRTG